MTTLRRAIAIFTARESLATLLRTIAAAERASADVASTIDVVVNGNRALALDAAESMRSRAGTADHALRVWSVALGDKAHAWNQYVHTLAPQADVCCLIDGYARVEPGALAALDAALAAHPEAWGASGVPSVGRSAAKLKAAMLEEAGLHGNLYALRGTLIDRIRASGFRLPLGIYRNDSLLGAALCFSFDPAAHAWNPLRIVVSPDATWDYDPLNWWRVADLVAHFKRTVRQAQGVVENFAVRQHLGRERRTPESLPATTAELVGAWIKNHPDDAHLLRSRPLCRRAIARLLAPRDWSKASVAPELLYGEKHRDAPG